MAARETVESTPYDLPADREALSAEGARLDSRGFEEFRNICEHLLPSLQACCRRAWRLLPWRLLHWRSDPPMLAWGSHAGGHAQPGGRLGVRGVWQHKGHGWSVRPRVSRGAGSSAAAPR